MVVGGWCSYLNKRSLHNLIQFTSKCRESGSAAQSRFDVGGELGRGSVRDWRRLKRPEERDNIRS